MSEIWKNKKFHRSSLGEKLVAQLASSGNDVKASNHFRLSGLLILKGNKERTKWREVNVKMSQEKTIKINQHPLRTLMLPLNDEIKISINVVLKKNEREKHEIKIKNTSIWTGFSYQNWGQQHKDLGACLDLQLRLGWNSRQTRTKATQKTA